jgi:tryptophanyl-tRNA synthetase
MVQFKQKAGDREDKVSVGLFTYPVLMSADILLYAPHLVPVGDDQKQHLELAQILANRFNHVYAPKKPDDSAPVFIVPEALTREEGARIMSLTDGGKKMSKSDAADQSRINLLDSPDMISRKIKRAKTDLAVGLEFGNDSRSEVHNLLTIYQLVSGKTREEVAQECRSMNFGRFKPLLADALIAHLEPIQKRYTGFIGDKAQLQTILKDGSAKARAVAETTLTRAKTAMGFASTEG